MAFVFSFCRRFICARPSSGRAAFGVSLYACREQPLALSPLTACFSAPVSHPRTLRYEQMMMQATLKKARKASVSGCELAFPFGCHEPPNQAGRTPKSNPQPHPKCPVLEILYAVQMLVVIGEEKPCPRALPADKSGKRLAPPQRCGSLVQGWSGSGLCSGPSEQSPGPCSPGSLPAQSAWARPQCR